MHIGKLSKMLLIGLAGILWLTGPVKGEPVKKSIQEKIGDLEFQYEPSSGVKLNVFGVPMVKGSTFFVIWPRWAGVFYEPGFNKQILENAEIKRSKDKIEITLHHQSVDTVKWPVTGTETFVLGADNSYQVDIRFTFSNPTQAAHFDWVGAQFYSAPFLGKAYEVVSANGSKKGIYPLRVGENGPVAQDDAIIARGFKQVKWDTTIGPVTMTMDQPAKEFMWLDYRRVDWAMPGAAAQFWMGILGEKIKNAQEYHYGLTLNFPAKSDKIAKVIPELKAPVVVQSVPDAMQPNQDPQTILPKPKELQFTGKSFPITNPVKVYVGESPSVELLNAVSFLSDELKNKYQIKTEVVSSTPVALSAVKNAIIIGDASKNQDLTGKMKQAGVVIPDNAEGYALSVTPEKVLIAAHSPRGIFYGITSLVQLVKLDTRGISFKGVSIKDYPSLAFRGIHMYTGKDRGDEQSKAVRDLQARFKINNLIWNCEAINWDRHPELHNKTIGMEKSDAQKVVNTANKHFMEVTPSIPALGHSDWMFWNGQNKDLMEDSTKPESYCPDNPKSYDLLFDVYAEAIDMFKSRYFHISECEIFIPGTPVCKEIIQRTGKSKMDIILDDERKIAKWFKPKNITPMLWGDMFLKPGEGPDATNSPDPSTAEQNRKDLPKDYIVTDWHYGIGSPESYKSIELFQETGNQVIGAAWYLPNNIRSLALQCINKKALGFLQTTWAGFSMKITDDPENWMQYQAYLWAAHYAWSGDTTVVNELPFDASQLFIDTWFDKAPVLKAEKGFVVDLSKAYNRALADTKRGDGWVGFGSELDFSGFPTGRSTLGETNYLIQTNAKKQAALMLAGRMNPPGTYPQSVSFELKYKKASKLHFLLTTGFRENDKTDVGQIKVTYVDGTSDTLKLVYHQNIWAFNDLRVATSKESLYNGRIAWKKKTPGDEYVGVRDVIWTNPQPGKNIQSVTITSANTVASPILLAVTGVE